MLQKFFALPILLLSVSSYASLGNQRIMDVAPFFDPGLGMPANSEQRMPLALGPSFYDVYILKKDSEAQKYKPTLATNLKNDAEKAALKIYGKGNFGGKWIEFETWPTGTDSVLRQWVFARYKFSESKSWHWLEKQEEDESFVTVKNVMNRHEIFDDISKLGLYEKPLYGNCVFTNKSGDTLFYAWPKIENLKIIYKDLGKKDYVCRSMPMPSVFFSNPFTFLLQTNGKEIKWVTEFENPESEQATFLDYEREQRVFKWDEKIKANYINDVKILSGEVKASDQAKNWPLFSRKNSIQTNNQLGLIVKYLTARYRELGIEVRPMNFSWRGISQYNLIAKIPGVKEGAPPVIIADHIDTAFEEDTFKKSGKRIANPGADDNASATAGLLLLAKTLKDSKPLYPIWLVHLTGEEFPADDLGARELVKNLFIGRQDVKAVIVMDMISYTGTVNEKRYFQINAGESAKSQSLAKIIEGTAKSFKSLTPLIRERFSDRTFIHQTDAVIFSDFGFPVVLVNEWLNEKENWERPYYHQSTDKTSTLNFDYAIDILKTVIESVAKIAMTAEVR